ncbi:DUF4870 domain-containing protein [Streptomyces sp. SID14478]|uniref:DUF4870 domain-containing protein n=1 Tax=Streptomyces sp. SID14478 TaxID=2706073 RepID=UPI0013DB2BD4|nr:DUF4870 domain-containing protein [Streptomyces sp. SID14478]NEB76008.1 DUF4870 domain-containing protein [Streptomyces sp. SID14478]
MTPMTTVNTMTTQQAWPRPAHPRGAAAFHDTDKAFWAHFSLALAKILALLPFGAIVPFLLRRKAKDAHTRRNATTALNFALTHVLWLAGFALLLFLPVFATLSFSVGYWFIGWIVLFAAWEIGSWVLLIRAMVKAVRYERYSYPRLYAVQFVKP